MDRESFFRLLKDGDLSMRIPRQHRDAILDFLAEFYGDVCCSDCIHWQVLRCLKHPEWVVVTPTARYARKCREFMLRVFGDEG
jgi:hypothetical protein